jgi:hypothetical protein
VPSPTTYSNSGVRLTVNSMIKDPLLIRARMLRMMDQQFIMETLLRKAPPAEAGVILYHESTPLFTDDDASVIAEAAEIPLVQGQDGVPKAAFTIKTGLGIEITIEMRNRNRIDLVNTRMTQVRNTITRHWERRLFDALNAAVPSANVLNLDAGGTGFAANSWYSGSAPKIRDNIIDATQLVREAVVPGQGTDAYLGFEPDTLVVSTRTATVMMKDDEFRKVYENSPLAERNPFYTGQLERQALGLNILTSRFMNDDYAFLVERNTVGGYSDERPLNVSPTYPDQDREIWRSNVIRHTGIFIDQPYAVAKIAALKTDPTP